MAFVRLDKNLPRDPTYPANLKELGYTLNEKGQIVRTGTDQDFFLFYPTDNDRANETHKEAMHETLRAVIEDQVYKLGMQYLHCRGNTFAEGKPSGDATIPILVTGIDKLKTKKDVIVIVGEHTQDLGIWSYRLTTNEGGIEAGTAVGFLKKLQQWETKKATHATRAASNDFTDAMKRVKLGAKDEYGNDEDVPGVIILNCGQLLWSNKERRAMNQATWLARPKKNAIDEHLRIDSFWNRVDGHENPRSHVESVFNHVIPKLVDDEARFYFVGISDGAEALLQYLGSHYYGVKKPAIAGHIEAFAFMQPTHNVNDVTSLALEGELRRRGKSWILDASPRGTLLATAELGAVTENNLQESYEIKKPVVITRRRHGSRSSTSSPINVPGTTGRSDKEDAIAEDIRSYVHPRLMRPRFFSDASSYFMPSTSPIPESFSNKMSGIDFRPRHMSISSTVPPSLVESLTSLDSSRSSVVIPTPSTTNSGDSTIGKSSLILESWDQLPQLDEEEASTRMEVSMPTFSAGVDLLESIFPAVMDDVLDYFQHISANADEFTKRARLIGLEGDSSEEELGLEGV
ncbi:Arb2 domain [Teratosphaeria destructans]|uniref:Arb2 domain n=1 Tax=Teratosphaeria destructans TaxID=418781 RepID=A0A9W7SMJ0_9PEZI|nr:Arb2 domain [Teratosphaeria destructans]